MHFLSTETKELAYAYNVIREFFSDIGLGYAKQDTEALIRYATVNRFYKNPNPGNLLYFKERFDELAAAAFTISKSYPTRKDVVIEMVDGGPDISKQVHFIHPGGSPEPWKDFPRNLTARQYADPYKAISKFTRCRTEPEWKKLVMELVEYALTKDTLDDAYSAHELMEIRRRMLQLIEACHLIHVRSNFPAAAKENKNSKPKKK